MFVHHLTLRDFRNYRRQDLALPPATILLYGPNAAGKTSLLEAIFYLATTRSPRLSSDRELVRWEAVGEAGTPPFARIAADVERRIGAVQLEVLVQRRTDDDGQLINGAQKLVRIDKRPARAIDLIGQLRVVLFMPTDLMLVDGPPAERRRYLDITLSQLDPHYVRTLAHYQKLLLQRNSLLRAWREQRRLPRNVNTELAFWDQELAAAGGYLLAERLRAVVELGALAGPLYRAISGGEHEVQIEYAASVDLGQDHDAGSLAYRLRQAFEAQRADELARGQTLCGPHRDDLIFRVAGVDLGRYGSRGQQRAIALALKIGEAELMRQRGGDAPVLLLDDVLSELDAQRRAHLLDLIQRPGQQTLLTATDLSDFSADFLTAARRFRIEDGQVFAG
ncbi:DNA replication/repair protein RecF [uncultured Chloroflexus sp.]|uniref:DNA replication/repair protein RecF n=1 Tax=uncultured Chloroflexus sp. TaxID=214040 RepID=UPI00261C3155|nr:DNA replication/repair protein RecF [uncultured Chloroflexus sp.]